MTSADIRASAHSPLCLFLRKVLGAYFRDIESGTKRQGLIKVAQQGLYPGLSASPELGHYSLAPLGELYNINQKRPSPIVHLSVWRLTLVKQVIYTCLFPLKPLWRIKTAFSQDAKKGNWIFLKLCCIFLQVWKYCSFKKSACSRKLGWRIHFGEVINLSQFDQTKGLGVASLRNLLRVERSIQVQETGLQS